MAKSKRLHAVNVQLPGRSYPIHIGTGFLSDATFLNQFIPSKQVFVVSNETVAPKYMAYLAKAFESIQCDQIIIPDGEEYKDSHHLNLIFDALIKKKHHRDTTLIALGGGVIGDITGLAASLFQRGVRFVQIPTTLLAQVDASVGGKTAINHPAAKNMIGSFYQPHAVLMDLDTLSTLPEREFRSGMAEVIKYAMIAGEPLLSFLYEMMQNNLLSFNNADLARLIEQCCMIKANIVESDERESGSRALLNLGHTFAHALESITNYKRWRHGEAVAIGLYCAAVLSNKMGLIKKDEVEQIDSLLKCSGLPSRVPREINISALIDIMYTDKKVKNDKLRFILLKSIGCCYIEGNVPEEVLQDALLCSIEGEIA
jgi:3-dehydroquinate synthase